MFAVVSTIGWEALLESVYVPPPVKIFWGGASIAAETDAVYPDPPWSIRTPRISPALPNWVVASPPPDPLRTTCGFTV